MKNELGKITNVDLCIEDHGILTLMVSFDFGGTCQGFGGYALDTSPAKPKGPRIGSGAGTDFILRLLRLFGVNRLEEIVGRSAYAIRETDGWNSPIIGIETPKFDGGEKFLVADWRAAWFPEDGET